MFTLTLTAAETNALASLKALYSLSSPYGAALMTIVSVSKLPPGLIILDF
jgi:hypothetical protein